MNTYGWLMVVPQKQQKWRSEERSFSQDLVFL